MCFIRSKPLLSGSPRSGFNSPSCAERTSQRAAIARFDRPLTCVFRREENLTPPVRTIDKTMSDGHELRATQARRRATQARRQASQARRKATQARRPPSGLSVCTHVRKSARSGRASCCGDGFLLLRFLDAGAPRAVERDPRGARAVCDKSRPLRRLPSGLSVCTHVRKSARSGRALVAEMGSSCFASRTREPHGRRRATPAERARCAMCARTWSGAAGCTWGGVVRLLHLARRA